MYKINTTFSFRVPNKTVACLLFQFTFIVLSSSTWQTNDSSYMVCSMAPYIFI